MSDLDLTSQQKAHLANLIEAIERCTYFLDASVAGLNWPLTEIFLQSHHKDVGLFERLAAINERFAKLQDTLGSAMRHSLILSGEQAESFLKTLSLFEKLGVITSVQDWQTARAVRNLAAHDYETSYATVAEHFNLLQQLCPTLYGMANRFVNYCRTELGVVPKSSNFEAEFFQVIATRTHTTDQGT